MHVCILVTLLARASEMRWHCIGWEGIPVANRRLCLFYALE